MIIWNWGVRRLNIGLFSIHALFFRPRSDGRPRTTLYIKENPILSLSIHSREVGTTVQWIPAKTETSASLNEIMFENFRRATYASIGLLFSANKSEIPLHSREFLSTSSMSKVGIHDLRSKYRRCLSSRIAYEQGHGNPFHQAYQKDHFFHPGPNVPIRDSYNFVAHGKIPSTQSIWWGSSSIPNSEGSRSRPKTIERSYATLAIRFVLNWSIAH